MNLMCFNSQPNRKMTLEDLKTSQFLSIGRRKSKWFHSFSQVFFWFIHLRVARKKTHHVWYQEFRQEMEDIASSLHPLDYLDAVAWNWTTPKNGRLQICSGCVHQRRLCQPWWPSVGGVRFGEMVLVKLEMFDVWMNNSSGWHFGHFARHFDVSWGLPKPCNSVKIIITNLIGALYLLSWFTVTVF